MCFWPCNISPHWPRFRIQLYGTPGYAFPPPDIRTCCSLCLKLPQPSFSGSSGLVCPGNYPDSSHPVLSHLCCCSSVLFLCHHAESLWRVISCLLSSPKTSILFSLLRSQEILVKQQGERKVVVGALVLVPTSGWSRAGSGSKTWDGD